MIPNPELKRIKLEPGDEFFIIASDGLWDVVSEEDAIDKTRFEVIVIYDISVFIIFPVVVISNLSFLFMPLIVSK